MYLKANAKINIVLNVVGKNADNYHLLDMIVLPIAIYDVIATSRLNKKNDNRVMINDIATIFPNNICGNVIKCITNKYHIDKKYEFAIYKKIPMESGLGGGSSDAAAIFRFYNKKFKLNISDDEAIKMLLPFGADIPFFIINKPARVQGIGEIIKPITVKNDYYVLVVKPKAGLSTKDVYRAIDALEIPVYDINSAIKALETGDDVLLKQSIGNVLEIPASKMCPKVEEIKNYLLSKGLEITLMSGSGTAVFSLSTEKEKIIQVADELKRLNYNVFYTTIIKED